MVGPVAKAWPSAAAATAPGEAVVDLAAIASNVRVLRELVAPAEVLAVVKADGYGHGMVPAARAAVAGGASWLGVAFVREALALRAAGVDEPRVLALIQAPGDPLSAAVAAGVDVSASTPAQVAGLVAAARAVGRPARAHLEVDTGLGRGGAPAPEWSALVDTALGGVAAGVLELVGIWSHFARADEPAEPSLPAQETAFTAALDVAAGRGARPTVRHLANTGGALLRPQARYDLVRVGLGCYGLSPDASRIPVAPLGLRPAMTLRSRLGMVKRVPAGSGVSYGHRYVTARPTTLGLVPLGYADGVPRHASGRGPLWVGGRRHTVAGTVCMDQFVVDLGDTPAAAGDEVVLFGPGTAGEPTANEWAAAAGTIPYEIVTRIGPRVPRRYRGTADGEPVR